MVHVRSDLSKEVHGRDKLQPDSQNELSIPVSRNLKRRGEEQGTSSALFRTLPYKGARSDRWAAKRGSEHAGDSIRC